MVEDVHELSHRTCLREGRQIALELSEDDFDDIFGHVRPGDIILRQSIPNSGTFVCAPDISIGLPSNFVEDGRVDGFKWV